MNKEKKISRLGLAVHPEKEAAAQTAARMSQALERAGIESIRVCGGVPDGVDAIAVLGGDGTILRTLAMMSEKTLPILGVNLGTLGFLSECAPEAIESAVACLARGEYHLEARMLLEVKIEGAALTRALNDVVISRGGCEHMLQARVTVDGQAAASFVGDGLIVSSPTGSTAYSLAAGGPVVSPDVDCMVLSPICPHTFSARPMVVAGKSEVQAELSIRGGEGELMVSVDGMPGIMLPAARITVKKAQEKLPFIRFGPNRFYDLLRCKLSLWGNNS